MNETEAGRRPLQAVALVMALALVAGLFVVATTPPAMADVVDVTTTWNVPVSVAFSVTFPFGNTNITFAPGSATFTDEPAEDQTDSVAAYNITNDGNVAIDIQAIFQSNFPTGVTEFRTATASSGDAPSGTQWWWTDSNETTSNQTIVDALSTGSTENLWAWSTGTNVVGGYSERTYRLTSVQN